MQRETNLKALHGSAGGGRCISLWDWLCVSICVLCACVCVPALHPGDFRCYLLSLQT